MKGGFDLGVCGVELPECGVYVGGVCANLEELGWVGVGPGAPGFYSPVLVGGRAPWFEMKDDRPFGDEEFVPCGWCVEDNVKVNIVVGPGYFDVVPSVIALSHCIPLFA